MLSELKYDTPYIRQLKASADARAIEMAERYKTGATLAEIGDYYGISRERVRQLIKRVGFAGKDGGVAVRAKKKAKAAAGRRHVRFLSRYGMNEARFRQANRCLDASGATPIHRFRQQKGNAGTRGIDWRLTFAEWWAVWEESGMWKRRGRGGNGYVMARHGDSGAYEVGNVKIIRSSANNSEYIRRYWREVNTGRRPSPKNLGRLKTHCLRGHAFTPENTYVSPAGARDCRACRRIRERRFYEAKRARRQR